MPFMQQTCFVLHVCSSALSITKEKLTVKMFPCEINTILQIFRHVIHFPSLQFALDFVETHRIKECHVSACCKSGRPVQGTDSPLLSSYRRRPDSKQRPVGVWNVDGEVLRQASLSLRYAMSDFSHNLFNTKVNVCLHFQTPRRELSILMLANTVLSV